MATSQYVVGQDDFSSGMVRSSAPHLIPDDGVYDIENGLLTDDGSIFKRGGTDYYSTSGMGTSLRWLWDGHVGAGQRTVFASSADFGTLLSTKAPRNLGNDGLSLPTTAAEIDGYLFIGGGYIYAGSEKASSYSTGTVTVEEGSKTVTGSGTTWSASNVDAGMLLQLGDDRLYRVASRDSNTQITLAEEYEGDDASGKSYTLHNLYAIQSDDPYAASISYAVSNNRLIWHTDREVRFSPLRSTAPVANPHAWQDFDAHPIPEGGEIIHVAASGPYVLIFTTAGIWRLGGLAYDIVSPEGTPQHTMEPMSRDMVIWGGAGVAAWESMLVIPATDGVYLLDGVSTPVHISANVDPLYRSYIEKGWRPGKAAVFRGHYLLPILSGTAVKDVLVCRLDRAVKDRRRRTTFPWSRLAGSGAEMAAYAVRNDSGKPVLLGAEIGTTARVVNCSGYFDPDADNRYDADDSVPPFSIIFRDFETGAATLNSVRRARLGYELEDGGSDDPRLLLDYGDGIRKPDTPAWGDPAGKWGVGFGPSGTSPYTAASEGEFSPTTRDGTRDYAPEAARVPHSFRLNKRMRYCRLRLRADERPAARCTIRRLELFVRPSQATRR